MKKNIFAIVIIVGMFFAHSPASAQCGKWRRTVKILTDDTGQQILAMEPKETTVELFNHDSHVPQLHITMNAANNISRLPEENQLVKMDVIIVKYKIEKNDQDIHIVVQSKTSDQTFVAEIPNPDCDDLKDNQVLQDRYRKIRTWFVDNIARGDIHVGIFRNAPDGSLITVVGVPFWDADHPGGSHPDGAGPHYREIHPVVDFINSRGSILNQ